MYYAHNKANSATRNTKPTLTDQAGARDTDINVIVGRFGLGNLAPGNSQEPIYGDFTELPRDLRGFLHQARGIQELVSRLPDKLKDIPLNELTTLTREQLNAIFAPPPAPPAPGGNQ